MALPQQEKEERLAQGLLDAAHSGDLRLMKEFAGRLDRGQGLVATYSKYRGTGGETALHYGAAGGRTNICNYLIEVVGLDVNSQNSNGFSVLYYATVGCNHQTMTYLIRKGANVNLPNHDGLTPVHTAAHRGLNETLQLLISNGADVEASFGAGTPLCSAASQGKKEAVKILLDNNANPNATSVNAVSPLLLSIAVGSHECINLLVKAGADPDLALNGLTPLEMAVKMQDTEAIKCLLKAGANPNVTNFREQKKKDIFMESKTKAAEAFKKKDYFGALHWYNMAIYCDPLEATLFSNRSLCYACLDDGTKALADAEACIKLKPDWSKAYYRKGVACEILKDFRGAAEAYGVVLKLEPGNKEIQTALRKVEALGRL